MPLSEIRRAALPDPGGQPSVKGLKVLRPGLHLGTAKKGRFEPSHALALTLHAADVLHTMDLPSDGREIRGYLNGETFPAQGEKGWYLITVDGYSTGWGKLAGGIRRIITRRDCENGFPDRIVFVEKKRGLDKRENAFYN